MGGPQCQDKKQTSLYGGMFQPVHSSFLQPKVYFLGCFAIPGIETAHRCIKFEIPSQALPGFPLLCHSYGYPLPQYFTVLHNLSIKILSNTRPLPSLLI